MSVFSYINYQTSSFVKKQALEFLPLKSQNSNNVFYDTRVINILKYYLQNVCRSFSLDIRLGAQARNEK